MNLVPTELNQRLASAVRYCADSQRFYISGKAGFWRLVGVGILLFGIGAATGLGFCGYSYIRKNADNVSLLSESLSTSLAKIQFKATAEGNVQIEPYQITLAPNQTISLESNSRVLLDPNAQVRADGDITIQGPAISYEQSAPTQIKKPLPNIVNFTVFKSVPFDKGTVQTGWIFLTSAQTSPTQQYCYYTEQSDMPGRNVMLDIGFDGRLEKPKIIPDSFDVDAAFSRCAWFNGGTQ